MSSPAPASTTDARDLRVFDAVRELLARHGMQLSMDAVAQRAGCSKQTLYSRYGSKQELMRKVVERHVRRATAGLRALRGDDLRGSLLQFATDYLEHFNQPHVAQACRLISADAAQFPDQARSLYRNGAGALTSQLAEWLEAACVRGQLRHDDPHFMAELLISMIGGQDFDRQRFHIPHRDQASSRRRWAEFSIDGFLRAFALPPSIQPHSNQHRSFS